MSLTRILLLNDNHPPAVFGGAETHVANLASALATLGHEVHVLARWPPGTHDPPFEDGYRFHGVPASHPTTLVGVAVKDQLLHPRWMRRAAEALEAKYGPFDVMHANNAGSALALLAEGGVRTNAPRLVTCLSYSHTCRMGHGYCLDETGHPGCGSSWHCARRLHGGPGFDLARAAAITAAYGPLFPRKARCLRDADHLIAITEYVARVVARASGRDDISIIRPVVPAAPPAGGSRLRRDVLFSGRLNAQKGCDALLEAFARALPAIPADARLIFAGDGGARGGLERRATEAGFRGRLDFVRFGDRTGLESAYSRARVQVVPSQWQEPFGIVAVEGLLRGVPLIATDVGGLSEIARAAGPHATLVPRGDVAALSTALVAAYGAEPCAEPLPAIIQTWTDPRLVAQRHLEVYEAAITRKQQALAARDMLRQTAKPS